jgi:hypothetical protein
MYSKCRPRFNITASEYRPDAPQQDALLHEQLVNVNLDQYVRESSAPAPVPLHTRLPRRFGLLTAEPLVPPKPAVTYQDKDTQTGPVVVVPAPEKAAQDLYMSHVRFEAAELRSDNIRLQREVDALTLAMKKLSVEVQAARSAEERRLAEDKRRLEQLERAEEQTRREQLERAARSAEERRLAEDKRRLEQLERAEEQTRREQLERAAEEKTRLEQLNMRRLERAEEQTRREQLERDAEEKTRLEQLNMRRIQRENRQRLPQLPRVHTRPGPKPAKTATPAVPLARTRTLNRTGK